MSCKAIRDTGPLACCAEGSALSRHAMLLVLCARIDFNP